MASHRQDHFKWNREEDQSEWGKHLTNVIYDPRQIQADPFPIQIDIKHKNRKIFIKRRIQKEKKQHLNQSWRENEHYSTKYNGIEIRDIIKKFGKLENKNIVKEIERRKSKLSRECCESRVLSQWWDQTVFGENGLN